MCAGNRNRRRSHRGSAAILPWGLAGTACLGSFSKDNGRTVTCRVSAGRIAVLTPQQFPHTLQARKKQIARLTREERLASLQVELSNKKTLRLAQLRKFARPVRSRFSSITATGTALIIHQAPSGFLARRQKFYVASFALCILALQF